MMKHFREKIVSKCCLAVFALSIPISYASADMLDYYMMGVLPSISSQSTGLVKKTGQTKSYDSADNEVFDGSVKDDGFYQMGINPKYTRDDSTNIVTDHITGLLWQDDVDAATITKVWLTQANYDAENYEDTSGDTTAATYCSDLTLGDYVWRLPTIAELKGIVDQSKSGNTIDNAFINVASELYWSSTGAIATGNSAAWIVLFSNGSSSGWPEKNESHYVRCISDGERGE